MTSKKSSQANVPVNPAATEEKAPSRRRQPTTICLSGLAYEAALNLCEKIEKIVDVRMIPDDIVSVVTLGALRTLGSLSDPETAKHLASTFMPYAAQAASEFVAKSATTETSATQEAPAPLTPKNISLSVSVALKEFAKETMTADGRFFFEFLEDTINSATDVWMRTHMNDLLSRPSSEEPKK